MVGGGLLLALAALASLTAMRLQQVGGDLQRARDHLVGAQTAVETGQVQQAQTLLTQAATEIRRANGRVYTNELSLVGWVPVVHQNLAALQRSVGVAFTLANGGQRILAASQPLVGSSGHLDVTLHGGTTPVKTLQAVAVEVDRLLLALPTQTDEPRSRLLLGPVSRLQHAVYAESGRRRQQIDGIGHGLRVLDELVGGNGPRRYFVGVANTAEMRGSGGMILAYAILESDNGTVKLVDSSGIDKLKIPAPVTNVLPADYNRRWDRFGPTANWRAANFGADYTLNGRVLEAMAASATGQRFDGAFQVDPAGLAAILEGIGPVPVAGLGTVTSANVVDLTLNQAYTQFPNRDVRQDVLATVATDTFQALTSRTLTTVRSLATAVAEAARQRHIVVWADDVGTEREAHFFSADGSLPDPSGADYGMLTVQNVAGNKLDYYLDTSVSLRGDRGTRYPSTVAAKVNLANTAPVGGRPPYVFGPFDAGQVAGEYRGIVSLYLPTGTTLTGSAGDAATQPTLTGEGGRTVATFEVRIPAARQSTVTLQLVLPPPRPGPERFVIVPQPRIRPTRWGLDLKLDSGRHARFDRVVPAPTLVMSTRPPEHVPVAMMVPGASQ